MTPATGEKEIVLGNKQLLGLFIVAVVMLAVFFAAGYMIGQKSGKPVETAQAGSDASAPSGKSPLPKPDADPVREPAQTPDNTAPTATTPVETAPTPVQEKPAAVPEAKIPAPEPPVYKEEPKPKPEVKSTKGAVALMVPEKGLKYVQVTALPRPESDNLVRSLRDQSFPAILSESSKEGLYRVLVGPFKEDSKVADTKIKLKGLGFAETIVYKPK